MGGVGYGGVGWDVPYLYPIPLFPILPFPTQTHHFPPNHSHHNHPDPLPTQSQKQSESEKLKYLFSLNPLNKTMTESTKRYFPSPSPIHPHHIPFRCSPLRSHDLPCSTLHYSTLSIPNNTQTKPHPDPHHYQHPFSIRTHSPTSSPTLFYPTIPYANAYAHAYAHTYPNPTLTLTTPPPTLIHAHPTQTSYHILSYPTLR